MLNDEAPTPKTNTPFETIVIACATRSSPETAPCTFEQTAGYFHDAAPLSTLLELLHVATAAGEGDVSPPR